MKEIKWLHEFKIIHRTILLQLNASDFHSGDTWFESRLEH